MAAVIDRSTCVHCAKEVLLEDKGDPWFHGDTSEERCSSDSDDFAAPQEMTYRVLYEVEVTVPQRITYSGGRVPTGLHRWPTEVLTAVRAAAANEMRDTLDEDEQHMPYEIEVTEY